MARTVWDDMHEGPTEGAADEELATRVRGPSGSSGKEPQGPRRLLPWLLLVLVASAFAGYLGRKLDEENHEKSALATARDEAAEMRQRAFAAEDALARAKSERDQASQAKTALVQKVAAQDLTKQADDKLISDLRAKLDAHDGDVSQDANRISVNLVDQILFKSGDANISPRGKKVLDQVGAVLKGLSNKQILVGGHTDDRPIHTAQFPSNWELSTARAVNVVRYLAETVGVSPDKLTAAGFSQFHPRSKTSKAKNRRIEILLTPMVEVKKK